MKWDYVAFISISITDYLSAYQCSWWWTEYTTRHNYQRSYYINKYSVSRIFIKSQCWRQCAIPFCRISVYKHFSVPNNLITLINFYKIIIFLIFCCCFFLFQRNNDIQCVPRVFCVQIWWFSPFISFEAAFTSKCFDELQSNITCHMIR